MTLKERFSRCLDRFVPSSGIVTPEDGRRARFAIGLSLVLTPIMATLAITQFAWGNPEGGWGSAAIGATLAAAPFLYRRWGRLAPVVHGGLAAGWLALLYIAVSSRGAGINAATVGLAELPLFAVLLTGLRGGAIWAAIACSTSLALAALGRAGRLVERVPPDEQMFVDYTALFLITLTLFAIGVLYESRRVQAMAEVAEQERALREAEHRQVQTETQAVLAHAEKLASIGRVTGAVAHEITSPLSYLGMNLEFIREELARPDLDRAELDRALAESIGGVARIGQLVARRRGHARGRGEAPAEAAADLAVAIGRAVRLAAPHTIGRAAVRCYADGVPPARAEERALVQVFLNLIINAAQALPEGGSDTGEITIHAGERGDWLVVEVRDNGRGIPPDLLPRLGEPFVTASFGEGTGLGLAVCKSLIRTIGGVLEFESQPGRTVARVVLPVSDQEAAPSEVTPSASGPAGLSGLRILVVDDDERVARSIERLLSAHEITSVTSGARALELLTAGGDFDLILCDLMMPGMTGMELYEAVARSQPAMLSRIIFSTGGAFTPGAREFCQRHAARVLDKPVSAEALTRLLVEAADSRRPAPPPT